MTKIGIATVLLCCLLTTMAFAGDSYLCVADMATGFQYNKALDKWEIVEFKVDDSKYIVSRPKQKNSAWEVKQIGENYPSALCKEDLIKYDLFFCEGRIYFHMNKNNLKFISIDPIDYYYPIKDQKGKTINNMNTGTPHMEIGKCSSLP